MSSTVCSESGKAQRAAAHKAGLAGMLGTTVEWYDFFVFTTASSLVFPKVYFPGSSPAIGVLASFATLWLGFLGRPVGAAIFGHFGDRLGRKRSLIATVVLMGAATTGVGLLPGYDVAGVAAPVLLCVLRLVQGVAVGGEWGGAVLLAGEHAPRGERAVFTAYVQQGTPLASILTTAAFIPFTRFGDAAFLDWGWRIPFLAAAVLMTVGLVVRLKVAESPEFEGLTARGEMASAPVREVLRRHSGKLALCAGASAVPVAATYMAGTFVLSWATTNKGFPQDTVLTVVLCSAVARGLVQPVAALFARRVGAPAVCAVGLGLYFIAVPVSLICLGTSAIVWIAVGVGALESASAVVYAVIGVVLVDAFPARVRYSGISLAQQLAGLVFGGTAPAVAQSLTSLGHGALWPVALYQVFLVGVSACCLLAMVWAARSVRGVRTAPAVRG